MKQPVVDTLDLQEPLTNPVQPLLSGMEEASILNSNEQCGQLCPNNTTSSHRGKCVLHVGHGLPHKCSVDGHTF